MKYLILTILALVILPTEYLIIFLIIFAVSGLASKHEAQELRKENDELRDELRKDK